MNPMYTKGELVEIVSEFVAPGTLGIIIARQGYPCDPMWFSYVIVADKLRRALGYQLRRAKGAPAEEKRLRDAAAKQEVAEAASVPIAIDSSKTYAITDTNVLLDVLSCHDLVDVCNDPAWPGHDDPETIYRRARIRDSLLLAMYLNKIDAITWSLQSEPVEILSEKAPPRAQSMESHFTTEFLHFVKDHVLPRWEMSVPREPDKVRANEADMRVMAAAAKHGIPLITNEGFKVEGVVEEKMRKKAKQAGLPVFTPREFFAGKIDEATEIQDFLRRFEEAAPAYLKTAPVNADKVLAMLYGYYRHVLLGETNGRDKPVRVTV